jgi:hypothetical protein
MVDLTRKTGNILGGFSIKQVKKPKHVLYYTTEKLYGV